MRTRSIGAAVAAAVAVAAAGLAAAAPAATVSLRLDRAEIPKAGGTYLRGTTTWTAAPGEANRLTIAIDRDGEVVLRDAGAPLTAGDGCRALADGAVACAPPEGVGNRLVAEAGDGDDELVLRGATTEPATVDAGPGDDRVASQGPQLVADGGPGADLLAGGDAADWLDGGAGSDELRGGGGDDQLRGDDPAGPYAADRIDGGDGAHDHVSYSLRRQGVVVDLAEGSGGVPGEGDVLAGVEDVTGSARADVLRGDDGPNRLDSGHGAAADVLEGRGGDDELEAVGPSGRGGAAAVLRGGDGDDSLLAFGRADADGGAGDDRVWGSGAGTLRCGTGSDRARPREASVVAADCERIWTPLFELSAIRASGRRLAVTVGADTYPLAVAGTCGAELVVRAGGRVLGSTTARIPERQRRRLRLALRSPLPPTARFAVGLLRCERGRRAVDRRAGRDGFRFRTR